MVKKEKFLVEGMSCAGCERVVQNTLDKVRGVHRSTADFQNASVAIEYDSAETDIENLRTALQVLGYHIVGTLPPHGQRAGNDEAVS